MKLIFKIQKPASFFYLLESLSDWNAHTRKGNREFLIDNFKFSLKDKLLLRKYAKLRKKYPWKQLDSDFILSEDFKQVEKKLKRRLNQKEFELMKKILHTFHEKFHIVYKNYETKMQQRKQLLEELTKEYPMQKILNQISKFYEAKFNLKEIQIQLVVNPSGRGGGGANVYPANCIQIEPRKIEQNKKEHAQRDIAIMIHEITHLIEKRVSQNKWRKFENKVKAKNLNFTILREAITSSIAPEGYITKKYNIVKSFHESDKEIKKLSKKILPLTKKQFEKKKSIFQDDYLDECIKIYKSIA